MIDKILGALRKTIDGGRNREKNEHQRYRLGRKVAINAKCMETNSY